MSPEQRSYYPGIENLLRPSTLQRLLLRSASTALLIITLNTGIVSGDGGGVTSSMSIRIYPQRGGSGLETQPPDLTFMITEITRNNEKEYTAERDFLQRGGTEGLENEDPDRVFPIRQTVKYGISTFRRLSTNPAQPNP